MISGSLYLLIFILIIYFLKTFLLKLPKNIKKNTSGQKVCILYIRPSSFWFCKQNLLTKRRNGGQWLPKISGLTKVEILTKNVFAEDWTFTYQQILRLSNYSNISAISNNQPHQLLRLTILSEKYKVFIVIKNFKFIILKNLQ